MLDLNKLKPVAEFIMERRGRFAIAGTVLALYPLIRRPRHTWSEFEADFRMYDEMKSTRK